MESYVSIIQTLSGRDKVMRATSCGAVILSSFLSASSSTRFLTLAKQISSARTIIRLFDDIPALKSTLKWGREENDLTSWLCTIASNVAVQIFYIAEHVAWAADIGVLALKRTKSWWTTSVLFWSISLFSNIAKSSKLSFNGKDGLKTCEEEIKIEVLNLVKNFFDFIIAISLLPWRGFLWAGRSSQRRNAFMGLISSIASIMIILTGFKKVKKDQNMLVKQS